MVRSAEGQSYILKPIVKGKEYQVMSRYYPNLKYITGLKPNLIVDVTFSGGGVYPIATDANGNLFFNRQQDSLPISYMPHATMYIRTSGQTLTSSMNNNTDIINPGDPDPQGYYVPFYPGVPLPWVNKTWSKIPILFTFYTSRWVEQPGSFVLAQADSRPARISRGELLSFE
jgi:hypothetical protein